MKYSELKKLAKELSELTAVSDKVFDPSSTLNVALPSLNPCSAKEMLTLCNESSEEPQFLSYSKAMELSIWFGSIAFRITCTIGKPETIAAMDLLKQVVENETGQQTAQ